MHLQSQLRIQVIHSSKSGLHKTQVFLEHLTNEWLFAARVGLTGPTRFSTSPNTKLSPDRVWFRQSGWSTLEACDV